MSKKEPTIDINSHTIVGSVYSQVVSVTVTDIELTIEFAYINPRTKQGEVVSRVTLPRIAGEGLASAILNTIKVHEEKKERKKE